MPRLEVDGVGMLSFPVPEVQVRELIKVAERAPFGRGLETIVDSSVRDCWQIGPDRIHLSGGAWAETFAAILVRAAIGLGCPLERIEEQFYKMLVYGPGGFFATHRDSEKAPGMVATLTIALPIAGEGGELIVRHNDQEIITDMNVEEPSELAFAAFYADCPHEIRPVQSGHRLTLIYNLFLRSGATAASAKPPEYGRQIDAIASHLAAWSEINGSEKIVWLLEHQYSESGLSFDTLKNADDARAQALAAAADLVGWQLHAAIVHIEEYGPPAHFYDYGYGWDWDYEEAEELEEVFDGVHELVGWIARDGSRPKLGDMNLRPGELLPAGALDDAVPDKRMLEEATGNEGPSLELAWRRAALVLWPNSRTLFLLASRGIGGAVAWVAAQVSQRQGIDDEVRQYISRLVDMWPTAKNGRNKDAREDIIRLLMETGELNNLRRFLDEVILLNYTGSDNGVLPAALHYTGPNTANQFLLALVGRHFATRPGKVVELIRLLKEGPGSVGGLDWHKCLVATMRTILQAVSAIPDGMSPSASKPKQLTKLSKAAVKDLFTLAWHWELTKEAEAAADVIAAQPLLVSQDRGLPATLKELHQEAGLRDSAAFATLWHCAASALLDRSATAPREPENWTIDCNIDCSCPYCAALRSFCLDPREEVARFPLRKDRRKHLHRIIDDHKLELNHVTERRGRPFTLVCRKNRANYRRRLAEYSDDIKWMQALIRTAPSNPVEPTVETKVAQLHDAVDASRNA
ncbi:MAG: 2OG-Fe(II) oxygenase [Rhodobacteraceae bacterium]|nr:2OG-Fe(II) oxygenase [Paracoccaceae bacterium]